jgi:hypothetical protein
MRSVMPEFPILTIYFTEEESIDLIEMLNRVCGGYLPFPENISFAEEMLRELGEID